MQKWEYMIVVIPGNGADSLNPLGNEGWEAVGMYPSYGTGGVMMPGQTVMLKRPKA